MLAAAHYGIVNKVDPGPVVTGNGYAAAEESGEGFASNWFAAVDRFEANAVLRDYLGARFIDMFAAVKRTEQGRFFDVVTSLDYDWCLRNA